MCVTVSGDMLLPAFKHSRILVAAMEKAGKVARYLHAGPFYLYHGCGLHSCWGEESCENIGKQDGGRATIGSNS